MDARLPTAFRSALIAAAVLGLFAVLGSLLVGFSYQATAERIQQNEREMLLAQLNAILPENEYDNDLLRDTLDVSAPRALGAERTQVYLARRNGKPVAMILSPVIARGYSGDIALTLGIRIDGSLAGVRVLSHKETPGLGDKIEVERSDWILGFAGRRLGDPPESRWKVKRDGGAFDQFTGATITPRGVVRAIRQALLWYRDQGHQLLETEAIEEPHHD